MEGLDELLGQSAAIQAVRDNIRRLLARPQTGRRLPSILIQGETGTGKGLVARLIHRNGSRAAGPFVDVNCAAIPETLLEAEFFGFERGAFTDARRAKPGLFQAAHRGTIFLDEVGLLPEPLQAKLLKVLEEQAVRRLGSTVSEPVDVWIISATNANLEASSAGRGFREDLYHRLAVLTLQLPPLRDRGRDVILLAERFLARACADYGLPPKTFSPEAQARLLAYPWPGNIRELGNIIERVALMADGSLVGADVLDLNRGAPPAGPDGGAVTPPPGSRSLDEAVAEHVRRALEQTGGNITQAATALGISRNTLRARIEKLGLKRERRGATPDRAAARAPSKTHVPDDTATAGPAPIRWERRRIALMRVVLIEADEADTFPGISRAAETTADKVQAFGGKIEELGRTSLVASFGTEALEDAPRRAAHAAMSIQKAAERGRRGEGERFSVKVALHVAQTLVARSGAGVEIDGDTKRVLQTALDELIAAAPSDGIIVSEASVPFLERRFDLAPVAGPPGSTGPSFALAARERTGFGLWGRMGRFVGRSRELDFLRGRPGYATTGHGQVVALVGEAGVGKSRLLWEFLQAEWTPDRLVLETSAVSYGKGTSYLPVLDLLRGYFQLDSRDDPAQAREKVADRIQTLDPDLATAIPALLALLDVPVDEPAWLALTPLQRRERAHDAATLLIAAESRARPLVLIFEDLHWADRETSALLDSLVAAVAGLQALVVVTYRPGYEHGWGSRSYYTQIAVDPLSRDSMEELLDSLVGVDPSVTPLRALLLDSAEGNPLFLEEMVRSLAETGVLSGAAPPYLLAKPVSSIQVPATVEDVLAARMDRLPADARHLLQCAAVIGRDVPLALLEALADLPADTARPLLARLKGAGFLYETASAAGPELGFHHALTHETAYGSLLEYQQRALHARAVTLMENLYAGALGEHADRLADHALRGGVWDKAVDYLRAAAGGAFTRGAVEESLNRYESALSLLPRLASNPENLRRAIDVRIDLHSPLVVIGQLARLIELHREAERLATELGEPYRLARVFHRMAWYSWLSARQEDGISYARRSLDIATDISDIDGQVLASHVLAQCLYSSGQHRLANELFFQTVDGPNAQRAKRLLSITISAYTSACAWLGRSLALVGDLDRAVAYGTRGIQAADDDQHPQSQAVTWTLAAIPLVYRGELAEALELAQRSLVLCENKGLLTWLPGAIGTFGWALVVAGRIDEGLSYLERAPALYETLGLRTHLSLLCVWWAEGLLLAGRIEEARDVAHRAVETAVASGERGNEAEGLLVIANVLAASEPPDPTAAAYYERVLVQAEELGMRPLLGYCHLGLGRFHLRSGARERGLQHLGQAATLFRAMGMGRALSLAEGSLGV